MSDFLPSQVKPFFPNSPYKKTEKEVLAAHLVDFLAKHGDNWGRPIKSDEFVRHMESANDDMPGVYQNPLSNPFLVSGIKQAVSELLEQGHLERVSDTELKITQKMRDEFYSQYVTTPENFKRGDIGRGQATT